MSMVSLSRADRVIVVGAGVAGLSVALRLAPRPVTLVTAAALGDGTATGWAQGGIAAAIGADDAPALHAADTEKAGAGLTEPDVAQFVTRAAPGLIDWLVGRGIDFDREADGRPALGLEAAHSRRRIVRGRGDATGATVLAGLVRAVQSTPSIEVLVAEAVSLMQDGNGTVCGLVCTRDGAAFRLPGCAVVLATGGVGALYTATTNPRGATGCGLLLAARAGARLRDLEFVQFHPTAIAAGADPMPLATEALRGEGAVLVDQDGAPVMAGISGGDLAPRDVVARGIFQALARGRTVFLDARGELGDSMARRFPTVAALCARAGIDPTRQPIPVRPAAHYHMGGVEVDAQGRTGVPGLWACGEVASTGLHGANRLASNSLLEAMAYAGPIAASIGSAVRVSAALPLPRGMREDTGLTEVRRLMEAHVGVVRDEAGLRQAVSRFAYLAPSSDAALTGLMIAHCALSRRESRGAHWRSDFPDQTAGRHTLVTLSEVLAATDLGATDLGATGTAPVGICADA